MAALASSAALGQLDGLESRWELGPAIAAGSRGEVPRGAEWRWLRSAPDSADRDARIRQLLNDPRLTLTSEPFDIMALLAGADGTLGALSRGGKMGLVGGAAGYCFSRLSGLGDPWTVGTATLAAGFAYGTLADRSDPESFTLCSGGDLFQLTLGWQQKPGYLPRARPSWAGTGLRGPQTAGASLCFRPSDRLSATLFFDPFAEHEASLGGLVLQSSF